MVDEGLGNSPNLVSLGDGRALAVDPSEFTAGHVPGATHVELGDLAAGVPVLPPGPIVVMCGHGERAMGAASLLRRAGRGDVAVLAGGPHDWEQVSGRPLETGL